ncbi:MAG TPA: hypothetical protein VNM72_05255 [Blastocatellia bacterium]|nr:hypothetical protein [Blastocatellia bacterium]
MFRRIVCLLIVCWGLGVNVTGQQTKAASSFHALPGYVVDERFSALRREPGLTGRIIERMRLGRFIAVLPQRRRVDGMMFYRVALSRRRRGWVCDRAFVLAGRPGHDVRLLHLIEEAEGFRRLVLARLLITQFRQSPLRPRALLILGEEADGAAQALSQEVRRREPPPARDEELSPRQWYLNDERLDRYNRLGIVFEYDETLGAYRYDGWAYREILRRYPTSAEAARAAQRLKER